MIIGNEIRNPLVPEDLIWLTAGGVLGNLPAFDLSFASGVMSVDRGGVVPSFSRASQATRQTQTALEVVAANVMAVDWVPALGGWAGRSEEQVSNLCRNSETLSDWTGNNATFAIEGISNPYGLVGSPVFTPNTGAASNHYISVNNIAVTVAGSTIYTMSAMVKSQGDSVVQLFGGSAHFGLNVWANFSLSGPGSATVVGSEVLGSGITAMADGWYRIFIRATTLTSPSGTVFGVAGTGNNPSRTRLGNWVGVATEKFAAFGLQMETGGLSSYIPTNGAAGVRQADGLTLPTAPWFNPLAGTIVGHCGSYPGAVTSTERRLINCVNSLEIRLARLASLNPAGVYRNAANVTVFAVNGSSTLAASEKLGLTYSTAGNGVFSRNGTGAAISSAYGGAAEATATLGANLNGYIRRITVTNRYSTNAELNALTA